ncbi:hypothetical protein FRZ44_43940 [Hypericibacter terrae]|jgi:hypothetical protein|uniref:Surface antigen domain-containing protein n=1 Tax=Hypericibacter terrae TaxID=2602015 RepID=A0A5J6MN48_9PROT|nr:hypothetical protein [Hypericibacter terrae]QEX19082.1 hypothetical protein FRZ44_43940 [Hypericibacter terrae]
MAPSFRPGAILALSLAAMAVAFALPAQAGPLVDPFGHTSYNLSEWDWGLLKQSVREVLEGQQVGASIDWDDPLTGKAGRATLLDVFTRDGMRCGQVEHVFTKGGGRAYQLPFCETSDGSWKIAF